MAKKKARRARPGRYRSEASLGPAAAGARPHAGRFRGARRFPPPARLPPRAHARRARALRPRRAALVRPAQHPLHHEHRDRRMGARQAHALFAPHRQRRALHLGFRQRRAPPQALRALAEATTIAAPACSGMRGAVGSDLTLFKNAAKEIKSILKAEGVANMPLGVDVVEPPMLFALQEARDRSARRAADDAAGARSEEHRRAHAAQHGGGDGRRRLPGHRRGAEARRAGIADRRARHQAPLRDGLRLRRGDQLDLGRALQRRTRTTSPTG